MSSVDEEMARRRAKVARRQEAFCSGIPDAGDRFLCEMQIVSDTYGGIDWRSQRASIIGGTLFLLIFIPLLILGGMGLAVSF